MIQRAFSFAILVALTIAFSGCGRTSLGARCNVDEDCESGLICFEGQCSQPDDECAADSDCLAGEVCEAGACVDDTNTNNSNNAACFENDEGICVREVCEDAANACSTTPCDIGCADTEVQDGCECVDAACETTDDCPSGLLCLDGFCDQCKEDSQCDDDEVCSMGACVPDNMCQEDTDCAPDQRCAPDGVCRDRPQCVFDDDCRDGQLCFNGRCTVAPECQVDLDCPDGQECVGGNCFVALCRGPEDCEEGQLCDAGECVDQPTMVTCEVATQDQTITENQRVPLEAFAFDMTGAPVAASFEWDSSDATVARVVPGPAALGGASAGSAVITARLTGDGTPCTGDATLTNPGPVMMNTVRVTVTDVENGGPVAGATVRIGQNTDTTDASGVASLPDPGAAYDVSVFDDDYNWLTVQGVTDTDIRLPLLRRNGVGEVAGFTGEFDTSALHSSGNITLGLAGGSLAGGLLELGLGRLLGDTFVSTFEIPGVTEETDIPLPGGIVAYGGALGFMVDLKRKYYAQNAGGPRIAWGLAGLLPFTELLDFFQGGDFDGENVLGQLLPLFNRFDHGSYPSVFQELPRVVDGVDIDGDGDTTEELPDYNAFPEINLRPAVRQNLVTDVAISNFPSLSNGQSELAILVGGVVLPSPGFVPTGISATTDDDGDGRPDLRRLSIAPAYGPLVGGRYAILAITFGGGGGGGPGPGGFELPQEFSVALWNGQNYPAALSLGTFPNASQTSDDMNRTISVNASAGPMFRVRMVGEERTWDVWSVGPAGVMGQYTHTVTVPAAPSNSTDLYTTGSVYIDSIQTNTNLDDLVGASGIGLRNAGLVSTAYNRSAVR